MKTTFILLCSKPVVYRGHQRKAKRREVTFLSNDKLNTYLTNCGNSCTEIGIWLYMTAESIDMMKDLVYIYIYAKRTWTISLTLPDERTKNH